MDPLLEPVAALQERDAKRLATEKELRAVPLDVAAVDKALAQATQSIEAERTGLRELELKSKQTEAAIREIEAKAARLRGQQLQVKKNDEYQALTREIDAAAAAQERLEEEELGVLYQVDQVRARLKVSEEQHAAAVTELQARLSKVRQREAGLKERHGGEVAAVQAARTQVPAPVLGLYDRLLKMGRFPVLAPVLGQTCGGCHMRVSNGVEQEARRGGKVTTCDNCGRIVYLSA